MNNGKKAWLIRIFAGGVIGTAFLFFAGAFLNALLHGGLGWGGPALLPVSPDLADLVGSTPLAALIQFALYFALGAGIGISTLPFAEDGKQLFIRSALHFVYTAAVFSALVWLCWWNWGEWLVWLMELALLALIYLLIWCIRWVTWYAELRKLRKALGLEEQHEKKEK